jgi:ATP-dependent DNA helicase RecG
VTQKQLRKAIGFCLEKYLPLVEGILPADIAAEHGFPEFRKAVRTMHLPESAEDTETARKALAFEELFLLQTRLIRSSRTARKKRPVPLPCPETWMRETEKELPFDLTAGQKKVLATVTNDITNGKQVYRLLQGEVGSGKTLVAFLLALIYLESGFQAAFMAPTELLARQHADNARRLLSSRPFRIFCLTGQTGSAERREISDAAERNEPLLLIGTHALFSEDIRLPALKFIIVDEQHRFGVSQRTALVKKGDKPDILLMTATPIPRTLAHCAYGDMDVSEIRTMPPGRKPVKTHLVRIGNEEKMYDFIRRELNTGNRAYFVYPLIEESEKIDLKNAIQAADHLSGIFSGVKTACLHSRLPEDDKKSIMADFYSGKIRILAATSVVEVGVDVPEATVMVVEHAERFGLSALHQLRGRVGRSSRPSYCFLTYAPRLTDDGKKRLMIMKETGDGFRISEEDLAIRGPGELLGIKQSGFLRFHAADLTRDTKLLSRARKAALTLIRNDPELGEPEHRNLKLAAGTALGSADSLTG